MSGLSVPQPYVAQNILRQVADINLADASASQGKAVPYVRQETAAFWRAMFITA